jgi:hypothetical protein
MGLEAVLGNVDQAAAMDAAMVRHDASCVYGNLMELAREAFRVLRKPGVADANRAGAWRSVHSVIAALDVLFEANPASVRDMQLAVNESRWIALALASTFLPGNPPVACPPEALAAVNGRTLH